MHVKRHGDLRQGALLDRSHHCNYYQKCSFLSFDLTFELAVFECSDLYCVGHLAVALLFFDDEQGTRLLEAEV